MQWPLPVWRPSSRRIMHAHPRRPTPLLSCLPQPPLHQPYSDTGCASMSAPTATGENPGTKQLLQVAHFERVHLSEVPANLARGLIHDHKELFQDVVDASHDDPSTRSYPIASLLDSLSEDIHGRYPVWPLLTQRLTRRGITSLLVPHAPPQRATTGTDPVQGAR